jgi:hypothetical protein
LFDALPYAVEALFNFPTLGRAHATLLEGHEEHQPAGWLRGGRHWRLGSLVDWVERGGA